MKVHKLLVAAQDFITRNGCSENLSMSWSIWVSLIPQTIKFDEIQPAHVEEMRFLFGTEEFVKNCKAEIHDIVSDFNLVSKLNKIYHHCFILPVSRDDSNKQCSH